MFRLLANRSLWLCTLGTAIWGGAMYGVLQGRHISWSYDHAVCGKWGCGPTTQALLSYHGFWLVLLMPPTVLFCRSTPPRQLRRIGRWVTLVGFLGALGIMIWARQDWINTTNPFDHKYAVHHAVFVLANLIDVPVVQVTLAGIVCSLFGIFRNDNPDEEQNTLEAAADTSADEPPNTTNTSLAATSYAEVKTPDDRQPANHPAG